MKTFISWKKTALALEQALQLQTSRLVSYERQWHRVSDGQPKRTGFYHVITKTDTSFGHRYRVDTDLYVSNPDTGTGWVMELNKFCDIVAWHEQPDLPWDMDAFLRVKAEDKTCESAQ